MSTGRRLAKRSIIGTKVCAPGPDGLWYSGVIQDVKTPPTATVTSATNLQHNANTLNANLMSAASVHASSSSSPPVMSSSLLHDTKLSADTKYIVRFDFKTQAINNLDLENANASANSNSTKSVIMEARRAAAAAAVHISPAQTLRRNAMIKEFRESDLIGPGFRSILGIQLQPGQRVFLTHNGRESSGDVISHDADKDEVIVKITAIGTEEPIEVKKRLEEVRLLESRRSARLADQDRDTDFARLADMGGDRRRTSNSIEITPQQNSRKRPPSYQEEEMNECNAALILMNLSNSPKSPKTGNGEKWLGSSPGSSSASWSSGSSSPPLSDDGHATNTSIMLNDASARIRTTSVSTSDEGIVVDFKEEAPRKKKSIKSRCIWPGCKTVDYSAKKIEQHIRTVHLRNKKARRSTDCDGKFNDVGEVDFYITEIEDDDDEGSVVPSPTSPPTLSHRDMARPPHEDPEYQRQIVGNFKQGRVANSQQNHHNGRTIYHGNTYNSNNHHHHQQLSNNCTPASPLAHHNYTWSPSSAATVTIATTSPTQQQQQQQSPAASSYIKHARSTTRPSQSAAPYPTQPYVHHQNQQQQHNSNENGSNSNSNNNSNSTITHSNSSANNVLQQLSQQNVTVTAHHSGNISNGSHQPQHQLSAVTITPNYHAHHQQQQQQQQQHHHHQQQHIRGGSSGGNSVQHQQQQQQQQTPHNGTASNIVAMQHTNASNSATSPHMHQQQQQHHPPQHVAVHHAVTAAKHTPNSPNRRTRGENKKCRKVYGMERRDQWCTQCRWKKACSRFGD